MRKTITTLVIVAVVLAAVAVGIVLKPLFDQRGLVGSGTVITDENEVAANVLGFVQPPYADDYGNLRVGGYVQNLADKAIYETKVTIELRDADGNRQEVVEHTVHDVGPNARKWFDVDVGRFKEGRDPHITVNSVEFSR